MSSSVTMFWNVARGAARPVSGERVESAVEAHARRLDEAGADLADARLAMGHAGVDLGKNAGLGDQPHVDPGGRAAEIERGDPVRRALTERDLVHQPRVL